MNGEDISNLPMKKSDSDEIMILPLLTASQNLSFYLGLQSEWLDQAETVASLRTHFPPGQPMSKLSHSKQKLLRTVIEVCIGDRGFLVLEEPTLGLDVAQKRTVYELINRLKQHRVIIIDTQDDELIDLLATQVV